MSPANVRFPPFADIAIIQYHPSMDDPLTQIENPDERVFMVVGEDENEDT